MRGAPMENTNPPRAAPRIIARFPGAHQGDHQAGKPTHRHADQRHQQSSLTYLAMLMVAVNTGIVIFAHGSSVPSANEAVGRCGGSGGQRRSV